MDEYCVLVMCMCVCTCTNCTDFSYNWCIHVTRGRSELKMRLSLTIVLGSVLDECRWNATVKD